MQDQNFSNHARYDPLYHFIAAPLIVAGLIGSLVNLSRSTADNRYTASLLVVAFISLLLTGYLVRIYALKAQDRAIRAEESLRHYILTGKPIDKRLRLGQIIALRFASDDELPELAKTAAEQGLNNKQIKQSIRNWRADHRRI
jgi:hypothetical protein